MSQLKQRLYPDFSSRAKGWDTRPARYFLRERSVSIGKDWDKTQLLSLTKQGVINRDIDSGVGKYPASFEGYQLVEPGNLVFCLFDVEETPRTIGLVKNRGMITSAYTAYQVNENVADPRFLEYLFVSVDNGKRYRPYYSGLRNTIPKGVLLGTMFSLPPLEEQKAIADFLDRELEQIDLLIEREQQLLSTLGLRRQALITSCVTKGLDSVAEMHDPGVSWLGDIPKHWSLTPLKYLVGLNVATLSDSTPDDFEFNYIEISDVTKEAGVATWSRQRFDGAPSRARRQVEPGDVLVSTVRTYLRAVGMVPQNDSLPFIASTGFAALSPKKIVADFLNFALTAEHFVSQVEAASTGISYPAINASDLVSIPIPVPPTTEQEAIAAYLQSKLEKLDELVNASLKAIDLLRERRNTIISAAVTGKIDVRGKK